MSNQRTLFLVVVATIVLTGIGAALIWGFVEGRNEATHEAKQEEAIKPPLRVSMQHGRPVVTLDPTSQQKNGIATKTLRIQSHEDQLRAFATVLDAKPIVELGRNYSGAKSRLEAAQAKLQASKRGFDRAAMLYRQQQNVSAAQYQAAEATYRSDAIGLSAAQSELRLLAAGARQTWGDVLGRAIQEQSPLFSRLIARRDVLLQITLPPGQSLASPARDALVELADGTRVKVTLVSAASGTDSRIQGASFYYIASAQSGLVHGMNLLAYVPSGKSVEGEFVPPSAVVWAQGRAWLYARTTPTTFQRREIATNRPGPDGGYFVQGLPNDVNVVVQGAQMLLSEELRADVQVGD